MIGLKQELKKFIFGKEPNWPSFWWQTPVVESAVSLSVSEDITQKDILAFLNESRRLGFGGDMMPVNWWLLLFDLGHRDDIETELIDGFIRSNKSPVQVGDLLCLYSIAIRLGLFMLAFQIRSVAKEMAVQWVFSHRRVSGWSRYLKSAICSLLEDGDKVDVLRAIEMCERRRSLAGFCRVARDMLTLQEGGNIEIFEHRDLVFRDFVKGRSVAIVGPVPSVAGDGEEIDGYDVVVRCNVRKTGVVRDEINKGSRTDVSYFNSEQARYLSSKFATQYDENVEWNVVKTRSNLECLQESVKRLPSCEYTRPKPFRNSRIMACWASHLFHTQFNAIPNILYDLLRFSPKHIKIFHCDLMLSSNRDAGYTTSNSDESIAQQVYEGFASGHDPVMQYLHLERLSKCERIHADEVLMNVLKLGAERYMKCLAKVYCRR